MKKARNDLIGKSILALVLVLLFCSPAFALTPEIHSIEPDHGASSSPTNVTIYGANFEATPKVALYGGGPTIVGSADTPGGAYGVFVSGNYAYVADHTGLQVIDITYPVNPTIVGSADTLGGAEGVFVSGNYTYVADAWSGLLVIEIIDPENPTIVGAAATPGEDAKDIFVSGNYAYVGEWNSGVAC